MSGFNVNIMRKGNVSKGPLTAKVQLSVHKKEILCREGPGLRPVVFFFK